VLPLGTEADLGTQSQRKGSQIANYSPPGSPTKNPELSGEEFPLASLALRELLAEPVPDDPVQDELWVNLVVGAAHEQLEDALVDATVR